MSTASESWPWRCCRIYSLVLLLQNGQWDRLTPWAPWSTSSHLALLPQPLKLQLWPRHCHHLAGWGLNVTGMQQSATGALLYHLPVLCSAPAHLVCGSNLVTSGTYREAYATYMSVPTAYPGTFKVPYISPFMWHFTNTICSGSQWGLILVTLLLGPESQATSYDSYLYLCLKPSWIVNSRRIEDRCLCVDRFHPWDIGWC